MTQGSEFNKWWEDQTQGSNDWTTLERLAALDAWNAATQRCATADRNMSRADAEPPASAAVEAIKFALSDDEGMLFLQGWAFGQFDEIRKEWPDAPDAVFEADARKLSRRFTGDKLIIRDEWPA